MKKKTPNNADPGLCTKISKRNGNMISVWEGEETNFNNQVICSLIFTWLSQLVSVAMWPLAPPG